MSDRSHLFNCFSASVLGQELSKRIAAGSAVSCANVDAAGWAHLAAALRAETERTVVLVTAQLKHQETLQLGCGDEAAVTGRRYACAVICGLGGLAA